MAHSKLSPSGAHRWMNCAGSVRMEMASPKQKESLYARDGTIAHDAAAQMLLNGVSAGYSALDEDMRGVVDTYVKVVQSWIESDETMLWIEKRFSLEALDPPADMFGTSDAAAFTPGSRLLRIGDLKTGVGVVVEVQDNPQLLYYALGVLLEIEEAFPALRGEIDHIEITIVQPRAPHPDGPVRTVRVSYLDLMDFAMELLDAARKTLDPDAPLTPGTWCRWCRAHATCPALHAHAITVAGSEFNDLPLNLPPKPETLPLEILTDVLNNVDILDDWIKAVRGHVFGLLENGQEVPGWKLVDKRATRSWVNEEYTVQYLSTMGLALSDMQAPTKLKSVAQMEKTAKAQDVDVPTDLVAKESSGHNLVPNSDPRPAKQLSAAQEFKEEV